MINIQKEVAAKYLENLDKQYPLALREDLLKRQVTGLPADFIDGMRISFAQKVSDYGYTQSQLLMYPLQKMSDSTLYNILAIYNLGEDPRLYLDLAISAEGKISQPLDLILRKKPEQKFHLDTLPDNLIESPADAKKLYKEGGFDKVLMSSWQRQANFKNHNLISLGHLLTEDFDGNLIEFFVNPQYKELFSKLKEGDNKSAS